MVGIFKVRLHGSRVGSKLEGLGSSHMQSQILIRSKKPYINRSGTGREGWWRELGPHSDCRLPVFLIVL